VQFSLSFVFGVISLRSSNRQKLQQHSKEEEEEELWRCEAVESDRRKVSNGIKKNHLPDTRGCVETARKKFRNKSNGRFRDAAENIPETHFV
jgi:hypothetical protein